MGFYGSEIRGNRQRISTEWSLAETIRRGAELLLRSYPRDPAPPDAWSLPEAQPLGEFLAPVSDWRALAYEDEAP